MVISFIIGIWYYSIQSDAISYLLFVIVIQYHPIGWYYVYYWYLFELPSDWMVILFI